ncbi:MAG: hypothetical protein ABI367_14435 [Mucilaginibacter sp.]
MELNIKKYLFAVLICLATYNAKAQLGYEYAQYDLGFAGGLNTVYGDAETKTTTKSLHVNFNYNVSPFINYVFEGQTGDLRGGDAATTPSGRQFTNNFTAFVFRGQVQAGEIMDYSHSRIANALKNFYLSTGIGYVISHMTYINRNSILIPGYSTDGLDNSNQLFIPARIGYEFKVFNKYNQPSFKVDLGYQYNFVLGDNLDGFTAGTAKDAFSQITLGFKFALGGFTSYRKQISY